MLGAMWPEHATQLRATELDPHTSGQLPRYPGTADILRNGRVRQESLTSFSATEREAADKLSSNDPRLATALADPHYNVTEVLAGAPQLVARYEQVSDEQRAVLNAAIDARRLGIQALLTDTLLCAAARGYLSTLHPDDTWFPPALTELTRRDRPQDHATAPLIPVLNEKKDEILGYTVADYLLQQVSRERRYVRMSPSTWDALIRHIPDPTDAARLADSAERRLLYCYAIPLYRAAAADDSAAWQLAGLLARRGGLDKLRARADVGDRDAARQLAELLAERGDLDELRARADAGDQDAARNLDWLLARGGDLDELRARADAGDQDAASQLVWLLARRDLDEFRDLGQLTGNKAAAPLLAWLLSERGDLDKADKAAHILRARADAGDREAARNLAWLLARRGDLDELRALADADDREAARWLAELLAERGDLDELRARADTGNWEATRLLSGLLAERGDLDEAEQMLRARADAGDGDAALLASVLIKQGRGEEAERLRRFGLNPNGSIASA